MPEEPPHQVSNKRLGSYILDTSTTHPRIGQEKKSAIHLCAGPPKPLNIADAGTDPNTKNLRLRSRDASLRPFGHVQV